jgi:GR25 family glycosyltransferase involved in LPS biosynthesis
MKVDRALIIRRVRVQESIEYANMCAAGCKKHGVPYEFIDGIEFMTSEDAMKTVGVWLHPNNVKKRVSVGNNNCHASHIKAWRRIVELNKACVIFEHDMIVKGNICNVDIIDMAINVFGLRIGNSDMYDPVGPIKEMVSIPVSTGGHAYALTPTTAQWFIEDAEKNGVDINVDQLINTSCGLPLYLSDPPQAVCWPRMSTREWQKEGHKHMTPGSNTIDIRSTTQNYINGFKSL